MLRRLHGIPAHIRSDNGPQFVCEGWRSLPIHAFLIGRAVRSRCRKSPLLSESERQKKAKLIFAGLFKTLNHERSEVMQGIERYFRKQREFSDQIRSTILQLRELQDRPDPDQSRVDELTNRAEWDTRIFEERRKTINFVCEVPVVIEQRLFALARAIQQSLE